MSKEEQRPLQPTSIEVNAGEMQYVNGKVTALPNRGRLTLQADNYFFVKLKWVSLKSSFEKELPRANTVVSFVKECSTGRVLLFESTEQGTKHRLFYWLQDKSNEKDQEIFAKIQEMFIVKESPANSKDESSATSKVVQCDEFKKLLAKVRASGNEEIDLTDLIASNKLTAVISQNESWYKERLLPFLPGYFKKDDSLIAELKDPRVSQAASTLQHVLRDPTSFEQIMHSFHIDKDSTTSAGVSAFLKSVINSIKKNKQS